MPEDTASRELNRSAFLESFAKLSPLILAEWEQLEPAALTATEGELDKVVALIAERTAHTKALVRRQLQELWQVVLEPPRRRPVGSSSRLHQGLHSVLPDSADELFQELEERTAQIMRELRGGVFKETRAKVKDNLLLSLLMSIGLGFIVGVLFTGWNFQRGK